MKACASGDATCASPLDASTTNSAGRVTVHVSAGNDGFVGYLSITAEGVSERLYFSPAIRNPQHPIVGDTYSYGIPSASALTNLGAKAAAAGNVSFDASQGVVTATGLDCNLSWRSDVTMDLDGAAPTAYTGPPGWVPAATPSVVPMWINVTPGPHTLHAYLAGSPTPMASAEVYVDAGGFTVLAGLGPASTQP